MVAQVVGLPGFDTVRPKFLDCAAQLTGFSKSVKRLAGLGLCRAQHQKGPVESEFDENQNGQRNILTPCEERLLYFPLTCRSNYDGAVFERNHRKLFTSHRGGHRPGSPAQPT